MERCETCKYWNTADQYQSVRSLGLGECKAVVMLWDASEWAEDGESRQFIAEHADKKAFVQDGSDYTAALYTMPDFGCTQHETA